jgi:hypothetical protein
MMTVAKEMNNGVALLLERMKTNPEEFIAPPNTGASKWGHLIESYMDSLEPEDQVAIKEGYKKIRQQHFTEKVLEELVDPKKSSLEDVIEQYRTKGITSVGQTLASSLATSKAMSMGATLTVATNPNSLTLGSTTINESHLEHLRAHVEALKKEEARKEKEYKTLYGRLKNYLHAE